MNSHFSKKFRFFIIFFKEVFKEAKKITKFRFSHFRTFHITYSQINFDFPKKLKNFDYL